jgi:hypothetical protein
MLKKTRIFLIAFFMMFNTAVAAGISEKNVPEKKRTKAGLYLNAGDAYKVLEQGAKKILFIDVRTRGEIAYTGMPTVADALTGAGFTQVFSVIDGFKAIV